MIFDNPECALLGENVFALGGRMANTSKATLVEWFDSATSTWREHPGRLESHATGDLSIGSLARDSLDCVVGCSCGIEGPSAANRITGNTAMAQVSPCGFLLYFTGGNVPLGRTDSWRRQRPSYCTVCIFSG